MHMTRHMKVAPRAPLPALLALVISQVLAMSALAQEHAAPSGADDTNVNAVVAVATSSAKSAVDLDTVIVTGSRIARQDYVASSPITTLTRENIDNTGAVTLEAALNQLPQLAIGANATNAGFGGTGQASLNLRGLGALRNLVLLDGRRLQPSDVQQVVDINTIPTALIDSVEIITGGASAVYGSDAIAGVVNVKLNDRFEGIQVDGQYGIFEPGDGATTDFAVTIGGNFAEGRGNAVLSFSHTDRDGVDYMDREFFKRAQGGTDFRLPTGIYRPSINPPSQAAVDAVFAQYGIEAGRVPFTSVLGFNDDGTLFNANNGPLNYRGPDGLLFNTGRQLNNLNQFALIQVPLERYTAFGRAHFDVSDAVTAYAQFNYATYNSWVGAEAGNDAFSVPVTNPFISDDLRAVLASRADPDAPFRLEKRFQYEAGPRTFEREFDVYQFVVGAKGELPGLSGTWDIYVSKGSTRKVETNNGSVVVSALNTLLNAADGGASLCDGGYNPFGLSVLSESCRSYLVAAPISKTTFDQEIVEASAQGRLFALPAGDVRFAAGASYRKNSYDYRPDRLLAQGDIVGVFRTGPSSGSSAVTEVYAETLVPLLSDKPFADSLDVGLAWRYSDYELAGGVDTYKADFNWGITKPLHVRGGYQRAVRAPSVGELFVAPSVSIPGIGTVSSGAGDACHYQSQPRTGADAAGVERICLDQGVPAGLLANFDNLQNEVLATSSGNVDLSPETADTYTLGLVWTSPSEQPLWSDLSVAVDYYDIKIKDVIGTIGASQILASCFNQDGSNPGLSPDNFYCSQISRDSVTGLITNVQLPTLNLGGYRTSGVDLQFDWKFGLDALGLNANAGRVSLGTVLSYLQKFEVQLLKDGAVYDYSDTVGTPSTSQPGSLPKLKALTRLQYDVGPVTAGLRWRYIDGMRHASRVTNANSTTPDVPAFNYFDLYGNWRLSSSLSISGGINNIADKSPPLVGTTLGSTQSSTYDIYGRQFYLGLTLKL